MMHTVANGETTRAIAHHHGVDPIDLVLANPHKRFAVKGGTLVFEELAPLERLNVPSTMGEEPGASEEIYAVYYVWRPGAVEWKLEQPGAWMTRSSLLFVARENFAASGFFVYALAWPGDGDTWERYYCAPSANIGEAGAIVRLSDLAAASGAMGDAPPAMVWREIFPDGDGNFTFTHAHRYSALVSVSANFSLAQFTQYLKEHGFDVTYAWEWGTPTRDAYRIDTWLAQIPKDTRDNHRWIYVEGNETGGDQSVGMDAPWPLSVYHVAHVFLAVPAPASSDVPNLPAPDAPGCPSIPSRVPAALAGGAAGVVVGALGMVALRALRGA